MSPLDLPAPAPFPIITLHPISDAQQRWVGIVLQAEHPLDNTALAHIFSHRDKTNTKASTNEKTLGNMLGALSCVIEIDLASLDLALLELALQGLAPADLPTQQIVLKFALEEAISPDLQTKLTALHSAGFRLLATGAFADSFVDSSAGSFAPMQSQSGPLSPPTAAAATQTNAKNKSNASSNGLLLKLLSLVTADADSADIEAIIKRDPNLSYQLLKLVNSVSFGSANKITNFSQAIALLGRRQLQRWLQLLLYAQSQGNAAANPLLPRAAQRAGLMEALARHIGLSHEQQDHAFMIGMFSLLESLFGIPLAEIITPLNLAEEVNLALLNQSGPLGNLLNLVNLSEQPPSANHTAQLAQTLAALHITHRDWVSVVIEGARWAVQVSKEA